MARCLIIGCGCRGRLLAGALSERGLTIRGTTRNPDSLAAIEAAGADAVLADPDRVATLIGALEHVTVACILLGSATGAREGLQALHGPRLEMLLTRMVDTTIHGVVYEARGGVDPALLRGGVERLEAFAERSHARCTVLRADPRDPARWLTAALDAVELALSPG